MTSRNSTRHSSSRTSSDAHGSVDPQAAQESVRQQLGALTQGAETVLRTAEVWQQAQLHLTQRSRDAYREAASRLSQANGPAELLSIQAGLILSGWQQAMQFNVDLMTGTMAQQAEAGAMQGTSPATAGLTAMGPMVHAWQQMFAAPSNGAATAH